MADSTAIITGGSRGLGLALARSLVGDGWHVVIDARNHDELARAHDELAGIGCVLPPEPAGSLPHSSSRPSILVATS